MSITILKIFFVFLHLDENEDLILRVRDYVEKMIFSRNYPFIFNRIAIACEEKDLSIQNRITSLHWITAAMLDTVLNENIPTAHEAIYKAMNGIQNISSFFQQINKMFIFSFD